MADRIALIGDRESIKGFAAIGFDIIECAMPERAENVLKAAIETNMYAIIFMTEEMFSAATRVCKKQEENCLPAIIPIPGIAGNTGIGKERLSAFVERAVGSDILFNN